MNNETQPAGRFDHGETVQLKAALEATRLELEAAQKVVIAGYHRLITGTGPGPSKEDRDRAQAAARASHAALTQYKEYLDAMSAAEIERAAKLMLGRYS